MSKIHTINSKFDDLYASRPEKMGGNKKNNKNSSPKPKKPSGRFVTRESYKFPSEED